MLAGLALLAAAAWLRATRVEYVAACALATAGALALAWRLPRPGRRWAVLVALAAAAVVAVAARTEWTLWRIGARWDDYSATLTSRSVALLRRELESATRALRAEAERALAAPAEPWSAFEYLAGAAVGPGERGVVLYQGGHPLAWSGRVRVPTDSLRAPIGAVFSPFYLELYATAEGGGRRAVATALVHADPPADQLATSIEALVVRRQKGAGFDFAPPGAEGAGAVTLSAEGTPLLSAWPRPLVQANVRLHVVQRARLVAGLLLALALGLFVGAAWQRWHALRARFAALAVALACVAIVPLNAYSNSSRLFDPATYYASLGGPFTASAGALGLTSAVVLLGLFAVLRARRVRASRRLALASVALVAIAGPFLLRDLARGIAPPSSGTPAALWLAWEVTLFLAAVAILLAGSSAGRVIVGGRRGLPPAVGPLLAAAAALAAPLVWDAPGRFPGWYPVLWIAAIAALALTRRAARPLLSAALVAALGAVTLVWGASARKRVDLAARDVASLHTVDPYAEALLERFGEELTDERPPRSRVELLRRYVTSDLAPAGFPVALMSWTPTDSVQAALQTASFAVGAEALQAVVDSSRNGAGTIVSPIAGELGTTLVLAVPAGDGTVTAVVVAPDTRLIPDDPFAPLLGLAADVPAEPPYSIVLTPGDSASVAAAQQAPWKRVGSELHGDWVVRTARGYERAHAEVELRSLDALVPRGALIVLLDLALVYALWALSAFADGGAERWLRVQRRRWARSYRARLTGVLFAFFVIPAATFAIWSYGQLLGEDRQSRQLLVRETLRAAAAGDVDRPAEEARRLGTPLLVFDDGALRATSDTLLSALAPIGRFLAPDVEHQLALRGELTASRSERLAATTALFGYLPTADVRGQRVVLAAPARSDDQALDERRNDLAILLLFTTALGAVAALWLSGVAARQFARPIRELRSAALSIAGGEREPPLAAEPPAEFLPVFTAFRRMAADLAASHAALEEATRRTAAVLRNVASGVIAIDAAHVVTLANPRADMLVDRPLPPGTPLAAVGLPALEERVAAFLHDGGEEADLELELDGRQLRAHLTRLTRGARGAVITLDDVTEMLRAQRVLAWGEMARQVAHEIKNPLTPIRLGVQHLRRARAAGRADFDTILEQNVERILAEIDRLDEIARSFSRYGMAPGEHPHAEPTDVAAVARRVVELERLGATAVAWRLEGADAPLLALAREGELRDVLVNVLENARLAHARTVVVRLARADGRATISVDDDGEGIPPEVLPRIFEPHFSTRTSGSGLGLAISRRLVESWGGSIAVTSERGKGTTVEIGLRAEG